MFAILYHAPPNTKFKYSVHLFDSNFKRIINFGDKNYEDYTMHHDETRKKSYILRHSKNENWSDPLTAGFWSRWLLWNEPTIRDSMRFISDKFGIIFV